MKILIEYDSSWRNSFLDGDNNNPIPKGGRKYICSCDSLKTEGNFIKREVTLDTVMGIINRLIGYQRKLYQSRDLELYYFRDLESKVTFEDKPEVTEELVHLRNISGNSEPDTFSGMIKKDIPILNSDYSKEFWGVLTLDEPSLCSFILGENTDELEFKGDLDVLSVCEILNNLKKMKPVENSGVFAEVVLKLNEVFPGNNYLTPKDKVNIGAVYCSALYLQLDRLCDRFDMSSAKAPRGGIKGISKRNFTESDFMEDKTTGGKKQVYGNPYKLEKLVKGQGKVTSMLTKARGELQIQIDVDQDKGQEISDLIENAGVSSFYLGKKGLAYVSKIRV